MITHWPSPAKLNLFLYITGKRNDGYHTLQTLFQFLNYNDTITIKLRRDKKINLLTPIIGIANKDNLIIRAAQLLMKEAEKMRRLPVVGSGADISIKKRLPIGGGLGGGSSNAATTLVALNYLWGCDLTENELVAIALKLGADVPIFIYGQAAFAENIGEFFSPAQPKEKWYLVVYPGIGIPTSSIFKDPELPCNATKQSKSTLLQCSFSNVCEVIARKRFHKVETTLSWMLRYAPSRLTGTGSCVFSEFDTELAARRVLNQAPEWIHGFVAQGVNLSPLKQIMNTSIHY